MQARLLPIIFISLFCSQSTLSNICNVGNDTLFPIKSKEGKWGYVNLNGKIIIIPKYDSACYFYADNTLVKIGSDWILINKKGKKIKSILALNSFQLCYDGKFIVSINGKVGILNNKGDFFTKPTWDHIALSDGKYFLCFLDKTLYILDANGNSQKFKTVKYEPFVERTFSDMYFVYEKCCGEGSFGFYYDSNLNKISDTLSVAFPCSDGKYVGVVKGLSYVFNSSGNQMIQLPTYEDIGYKYMSPVIISNLIPLKQDGKWSLYDVNAKAYLPQKFDRIGNPFSEGLSPVLLNGKWGFINQDGKLVIDSRFEEVYFSSHFPIGFSKGLAFVKENGNWVYIDRFGKILSPSK